MEDYRSPNYYISNGYVTNSTMGSDGTAIIQEIATIAGGWTTVQNGTISARMDQQPGIHPELFFKYIKRKFGALEKMRLDGRLKKLERAFDKAVESGQEALGKKLMTEVIRETRESVMYAKGVRHFIEREDLQKHKNNIRGGHISDTVFKEFTRVIPKDVLAKKKKVEDCFDGFVIYHYWDEKAEKNRTEKQKMTADEKQRMRDPVLFGIIRETNRLYFVADWEDEHCDLTFDEMVDVIGADDEDITISREPKLNL